MTLIALGLMSGTSCDGIDAAIIETDGATYAKTLGSHFFPYEPAFSQKLLQLMKGNTENILKIEKELTEYHAKAANITASQNACKIDLIGFHGQTIMHKPEKGITWQIGNIPMLAYLTKVDTVGDFRRKDVAAGGQGAPLVPAYLKLLASNLPQPVMFLNIGGVANLCYINGDRMLAFDCGPGNAIIDDLHNHFYNISCDKNGEKARSGKITDNILEQCLEHEFFSATPPKSLDRNAFNTAPLYELHPKDALATATEFTAKAIAKALDWIDPKPKEIIVSGGGRKNIYLMERIRKAVQKPAEIQLSKCEGHTTAAISTVTACEEYGFDGDMLEAQAFAYLAVRCVKKLPISFPETTNCPVPLTGGILCKA